MRKSAASLASVLVALATLLASPAGAARGAWTPAHLVRLPARGASVPQGYLPALACAAVGYCVAAGDYQDSGSNVSGLVVTETRGVWSPGRVLGVPAASAASATLTPYGAACGAVGDCVVVGSFDAVAGNVQPFIDQEVKGVWRSPVEVALPANAVAGSVQVAQLRSVACPTATHCVAVGSYVTTTAGGAQGLVVTGGPGSWSAREVTAPADANADPVIDLTQVACPRRGPCAAAGTYVDVDNATHPLIVDTATRAATAVALPGNASVFASATIAGLACPVVGDCVVDGTYETSGGQVEAFAATSAASTWATSAELVMPAGAADNPRVFFYDFAGLACHAPGQCATGGQYVDASGNYQGFLADDVNGSWRAATALALPAGATQAGRNGGVVAVTCPGDGACRAGAAYLDAGGNYQALVVAESHRAWPTGTTLSLPRGASTVGVDGGVYGLVCPTTTSCTAVGSYLDGSGNYQGFYSTLG